MGGEAVPSPGDQTSGPQRQNPENPRGLKFISPLHAELPSQARPSCSPLLRTARCLGTHPVTRTSAAP